MENKFKIGLVGALIFFRGAPGFFIIWFSLLDLKLFAGVSFVLAVWLDVLICWYFSKKNFVKSANDIQIEGFIDFLCFVIAPIIFVFSYSSHIFLLPGSLLFAFAGIYRICRYNIESLTEGKYQGLPVTYNGYLFPMGGILEHYLLSGYATGLFFCLFVIVSFLMVSRKIRVPEF